MKRKGLLQGIVLLAAVAINALTSWAASGSDGASTTPARNPASRPIVLIDTDIGDDVDDVFAVGLGLASPDIDLKGVMGGWGDTALRARMLDHLLAATGRSGSVTVGEGSPKHHAGEAAFSQAPWAARAPSQAHISAVDLILNTVREHPGEVTLVTLAPMTNLGDALAKDPVTFRKIRRIVAMGGSVRAGYQPTGTMTPTPPGLEYNIAMDPQAGMAVFASGVPIYLMPLDSTQLKLDEIKRLYLFTRSTPLTDTFAVLYQLWSVVTGQTTPTLYDAVAMAYALDPNVCPVTPMRLSISSDGRTREEPGKPNSFVCLHANETRFFELFLMRLGSQHLGEPAATELGTERPKALMNPIATQVP